MKRPDAIFDPFGVNLMLNKQAFYNVVHLLEIEIQAPPVATRACVKKRKSLHAVVEATRIPTCLFDSCHDLFDPSLCFFRSFLAGYINGFEIDQINQDTV